MWQGSAKSLGPISYIAFNTSYCLGFDAFVYGHKQSFQVVNQGLQIVVNGSVAAISTGQSEGHVGYQSVGMPVSGQECFSVSDIGAGRNRSAWYRAM